MGLGRAISAWEGSLTVEGKAPKTKRGYIRAVTYLEDSLGRDYNPAAITVEDVELVVAAWKRRDGRPISPTTAHNRMVAMRQFFEWGERRYGAPDRRRAADGGCVTRGSLVFAALLGLMLWVALALAVYGLLSVATAREGTPGPAPRAPGAVAAKRACSDSTPLVECRAALRRQIAATDWQRHARAADARRGRGYGVMHALRLASALYGVPLAQLVRVARCESHLDPLAKNRSSTASGLMQFLRSTWARAGLPGFSVFDAYANALAAARLVAHDGSFREWSCA